LPATETQLSAVLGEPDDLALDLDGSVLFSDIANGSIGRVSADGKVTRLLNGLAEPEGIVVLEDGSLIIAEQGTNRLLHFRPGSGERPTVWLALENRTGQPGVDGIARDPATGDLIVPDSPNGRILRVSSDGTRVRVVASGFVRPTGAWADRDGSIVFADEYGNAVRRIRSDGRTDMLGRFALPDDVAEDDAGDVFTACLGDNSIRVIDARDGLVRLVESVRDPQGLIVDRAGNIVAAEAGRNRIVRLQVR
jgi:sugar lactone lactonase YvrE